MIFQKDKRVCYGYGIPSFGNLNAQIKRANHLKSDLLSSVAGVGPEPTTSGL